jgi:O-acetyl-ADP-ribose deacetylase (regulator of RNase III)
MRVQQIRNIGALDGNTPVSANEWEKLKRTGNKAVEKWIDDNMAYRSCVIVLVGSETADRPWVQYEIKRAWEQRKGCTMLVIT